jgi:hypothetical protein
MVAILDFVNAQHLKPINVYDKIFTFFLSAAVVVAFLDVFPTGALLPE